MSTRQRLCDEGSQDTAAVIHLIPCSGALAGGARLALLLGVVDGGLDRRLVGRLRERTADSERCIVRFATNRLQPGDGGRRGEGRRKQDTSISCIHSALKPCMTSASGPQSLILAEVSRGSGALAIVHVAALWRH